MAIPEPPRHVRSIRIAADHPAFVGHFPGMPILPGAFLLDATLSIIEADLQLDLTCWQLTGAKFLEPVRPGDELTVEHTPSADGTVRFAVRIADRLALAGSLSQLGAGVVR